MFIILERGGQMRGTIKFFDQARHFGFIAIMSGDEVFFHRSSVVGYHDKMKMVGEVEFDVGPGREEGKLQAFNVLLADADFDLMPNGITRPVRTATKIQGPATQRRRLPSDLDDQTLQEVLGINQKDRPAPKTKKNASRT